MVGLSSQRVKFSYISVETVTAHSILGCDTVWTSRWISMFQKNLLQGAKLVGLHKDVAEEEVMEIHGQGRGDIT
jgi:hypothetical protein